MKNILLYIWQLPQNLLGLLVILFTRAKKDKTRGVYVTHFNMGISLGSYIIVNVFASEKTIKHEKGHQIQSKYLGIFYLLVVGLPSIIFNIYDRLFHKNWAYTKRYKWYYSLDWEKTADKLGGVKREIK